MLCPKCGKQSEGKWCSNCGQHLEETTNYIKSGEFDTARYAPIQSNAVENAYRDDAGVASDSEYYGADKELSPYPYYENGKKDRAMVVGAVTAGIAVLALIVFFVVKFALPSNKDRDIGDAQGKVKSDGISEEAKSLYKNADKYMTIGDYEAAEELYLELTEITDDDEAMLVYNILYNYNRAYTNSEDCEYEAAKKHFDKIPAEYVDYVICDDVEDLGDKIDAGIGAYETFEEIKEYMSDKDFEAAAEAAEILEQKYLSRADKKELEKILEEIDKAEEAGLSAHEAESLLMEYCDAMVKAINNMDFGIVSPYIDADSAFYETQKGLVDYCASEGITQVFDSLRVKSLSKTGSKTWEAEVSETETLTYDDGTEETKTYSWTYTIKYIDSDYYVAGIR